MEFFYLKRIQSSEKLIIPLRKNEMVVGRAKTCSYQIVDESISRNHALIKKSVDGWTMKNLSKNGLYLNDKLIKENEEVSLIIGSVIRFGFTNLFYFRFGMKAKHRNDLLEKQNSSQNDYLETKNGDNEVKDKLLAERLEENHREHKLVLTELENKLKLEEERKLALLKDKDELAVKLHIEKMNLERRLIEERKELESKLSTEKEELQSQLVKLEEERARLEQEAQNREKSLQLKQKEREELFEQRLKEFEKLKEEKEKLTTRLTEVETDLEEKALLTSTLEGELIEKQKIDGRLEALMEEKRILESNLKDAMEKGDKVSDLEEALKLLEAQKISLEQEVASVASVSETARKEILETVSNVLENELQCPICSELFITAIMLNCSHTFCKYCIDSWKKNKKDCPNCRQKITSETRSIVVDNFIDKIVSTLSEDMKKQRNQLIAERVADVNAAAKEAERKAEAAGSSRRGRGRGGRQNNRGRGVASRNVQQAVASTSNNFNNANPSRATVITTAATAAIPAPTITISSDDNHSDADSDDNSGSNDSDTDSESGYSDAYFGGYGRCYTCGRRGHWSNGCPYR